jgi:integrase
MMSKIRLSPAIEAFAESMKAQGKKPRTIKNNVQVLNAALEVWGNIYVNSIQPRHIENLFAAHDWAPSTYNLYLANLRGNFFPWARRHKHIPKDYDPTEGWRTRRVPNVERLWLPVEEFGDLLDAAWNERDRAILALGLYTFARGIEISNLRIEDLDFSNNSVNIYRTKTEEEDMLPMVLELKQELLTWTNRYRQLAGPLQPDWFVIPWFQKAKDDRGRWTRAYTLNKVYPHRPIQRPYYQVHGALEVLGYGEMDRTGTHTLRRSGARALFDRLRSEGFDGALMRVQSMLGHKDAKTTQKYLGLTIERHQRNEMLAGKPMFPNVGKSAEIIQIARQSWA